MLALSKYEYFRLVRTLHDPSFIGYEPANGGKSLQDCGASHRTVRVSVTLPPDE